jgi:hypothetical protein
MDGDYLRIYTGGGWLGAHHPWQPKKKGSRKTPSSAEVAKCAPGTLFCVCIQPEAQNAGFPDCWTAPSASARSFIAKSLTYSVFEPHSSATFFDLTESDSVDPPTAVNGTTELLSRADTVVVLRPVRDVHKGNLSNWIRKWGGLRPGQSDWLAGTLVLADLALYQGIIFADFLQHIQLPKNIRLDVALVTDDWHVAWLSKNRGAYRLTPNITRAISFLEGKLARFNVGHLSSLLRHADSNAFWTDSQAHPLFNIYRDELVRWHGTTPTHDIIFRGYLDVGQAFADPPRYLACKRALRRVLALFPELLPVAGDELLARDRAMIRSFLRAVTKGHIYYGHYPPQATALTQKVQRIDNQIMAKLIYDDDMLRHNPGGGLEEAAMRKVVERSRDMLKVQNKVELSEIFDLSIVREVEAELKKAKWEP